jgi:serine/threonine protein kinase
MVMQLCSHSLFDWLHKPEYRHASRGLPEMSAHNLVIYALGAARGLRHLHELSPPVVHRDIKSMNLLVDFHRADDAGGDTYSSSSSSSSRPTAVASSVKLCDYGLVTVANISAGTPNYMAPEMFEGLTMTLAVDVYAFAMLLWEMFTQSIPFNGLLGSEIKECVLGGDRPEVPRDTDECPRVVQQLIEQCWAQDPRDRPTMAEVCEVLQEASTHVPQRSALADLESSMGGGFGDAFDSLSATMGR